MKIGFFEAGLPNFDHDAGSTAVIELCALAKSAGHELDYVYTGENPWGRRSDLEKRNIPMSKPEGQGTEARTAFLRNKKYDVALISRPGPAAEWLAACKAVNLPIVYFGHDIHHVRLARGNAFLPPAEQTSARDIKAMQLIEKHIWQNTAAVIYPSREECDDINAQTGKNHALEMPIYDLREANEFFRSLPPAPKTAGVLHALFVGGTHHRPNHDAMLWFAGDVLAHIAAPFTLSIVGDWSEPQRAELHSLWKANARPGQTVEFTGRLSQDPLYRLYQKATFIIAPLRYGAGVKRKVVEVLALGRPVLSTPIGFEGVVLPPALKPQLCAPAEPAAYALAMQALLEGAASALPLKMAGFSKELSEKYSDSYRKQVLEKAFALL